MNNDLIHVNTLPPFKKLCMTIGELPTSYLESMTYYETLVWLSNYLSATVIPTVNNNAEAVEELQDLYIELKNYVDNYFENLDVQEEINKKLDKMAQDGTITNLIKEYIDPIFLEYEAEVSNEMTTFKNSVNNNIDTFKDSVNEQIDTIDTKVNQATSGSPLVASSTSGMTDTTRIYVNTTDGYWYYYNGSTWVQGGVYQGTQVDDNDPIIVNINSDLSKLFEESTENVDLSYYSGYIANENDPTYEEGSEVATSTFTSSDFVDLNYAESINLKVTLYTPANLTSGITFYDVDENYVGYYGTYEDGTEVTVSKDDFPLGTRYARFTTNKNTLATSSVVINNKRAISDINTEDINTIEEIIYKEQTINVNLLYYNGYIANTNDPTYPEGSEVATTTFTSSDFVNIEYADSIDVKVTLYTPANLTSSITYYNSDKSYVGYYGTFADGTEVTVTKDSFPENAVYARFTTNKNYIASSSVTVNKTMPLDYLVEKNKEGILDLTDELINPKNIYWAACGDSITHANHDGIYNIPDNDPYCPFACTNNLPAGQASIYKRKNYAYYISKKNQLQWANYGWGGTTLINCTVAGESKNGFSVDRYKEFKNDVDFNYITIFFGYNDSYLGPIQQRELWLSETYGGTIYYPQIAAQIGTAGYATQEQYNACNSVTGYVDGVYYDNNDEYFEAKFLGNINSSDNKTWYGAWNTVLPYLMLKYPTSKILLIVPYSQANMAGPTTKQKDAVIEVANKWGLPYYDFRESCPFMDENNTPITGYTDVYTFRKSYLTSDGLHPSNAGYIYMSDSIGAKLMSI